MKNYILFFFFAFQVSTYAQRAKSQDINFEKKLITLEIDDCNSEEKEQPINSLYNSNNLTVLCDSDDLTLRPINVIINQSKILDVSKSICSDYLIFNYNLSTVTDIDND